MARERWKLVPRQGNSCPRARLSNVFRSKESRQCQPCRGWLLFSTALTSGIEYVHYFATSRFLGTSWMAGGAIYAQKADVEAQAIIIPPCERKAWSFWLKSFWKASSSGSDVWKASIRFSPAESDSTFGPFPPSVSGSNKRAKLPESFSNWKTAAFALACLLVELVHSLNRARQSEGKYKKQRNVIFAVQKKILLFIIRV